MVDCINFVVSTPASGRLELAQGLGEHLKHLRRPGKAILISDFLMPTEAYQKGFDLLRAFNLDITAIQVLSRQEVDPSFPPGNLQLVDSETQRQMSLQWDGGARRKYQGRLAQHNLGIRSFCHQSGIHYSLYITDRDLADFVFAALPVIGLFK
jgi:hypothetical protein